MERRSGAGSPVERALRMTAAHEAMIGRVMVLASSMEPCDSTGAVGDRCRP